MTRAGLAIAVAAAVVLTGGCGNQQLEGGAAPAASPAPSSPPPAAVLPSDRTLTVPDLEGMTGDQASDALDAAGFLAVEFTQNNAPMSSSVIGQSPAPGTQQRAGDPVNVTLQPPPQVPHREIAVRDWQVIAKNPDAHKGERIIVYGYVTQFDAATGTSSFRASIDAIRHKQTYEYDTNTLLRGTPEALNDIVADDQFRAEVTIMGSFSYDTQIGGSTTVPLLFVDAIKRL